MTMCVKDAKLPVHSALWKAMCRYFGAYPPVVQGHCTELMPSGDAETKKRPETRRPRIFW